MKASRSIIRDFGEIEKLQVSSKGPGDFVSSADKRTEKIIIDELQKAHPDYGIVTEESGFINKSNKKNRWIIDPIDGTTNFLNGIPQFAISIGYEEENEIKCGVIFDPIKNEWIAENKGVHPDIEIRMDAKSLEAGRDPQLERAVEELMKLIDQDLLKIERPQFPKPAKNKY